MLPAGSLKIVIAGGTGYLGTMLARHFHEREQLVSSITRFPKPHAWESVHWDCETLDHWAASLDGADVVINLAGRSWYSRHTAANKRTILESRVRTTRLIGQAIDQCSCPPPLWLNASTIDIYADTGATEVAESSCSGRASADFGVGLAQSWEATAIDCPTPQTRKVLLRMAPVMSPDANSMFDLLLRLVRSGFGGDMGDGEQYVAWVHDFDFIRAIEFLIRHEDVEGAVNITSPQPMPNHQFMCNLRRAWCTSYFGLPTPRWLVEAVAFAVRTESARILKSRRVMPARLTQAGFEFHFPDWRGACQNLVERWRVQHPD